MIVYKSTMALPPFSIDKKDWEFRGQGSFDIVGENKIDY